MRGAIPPLPNTSSRCGAKVKHRDNFTFIFYMEMRTVNFTPRRLYHRERSPPPVNQLILIVILPGVVYGCETWRLTLTEEHRLRVFENRVLRRIFGPKR
jgi:hypothetical protein